MDQRAFHEHKNRMGKTIVFGHTITPLLHGDMQTTDLWIQESRKSGSTGGGCLWRIDAWCRFLIQLESSKISSIQNNQGPWQPRD